MIDIEGERQRTPVLSEGEVETLARLGLRIEALLGGPQDVEWAFDDRGPWILQARPVTALDRTVP